MKQLMALSLSIAVLAALATFAFLSVGQILIWAAFIAWACFFSSGGDRDALRNTIVCTLFGAVLGWAAALIILSVPVAGAIGLPLWAGIVVGVTVFIGCMAASIKAFAVIPATVLGYAATFAFLLQTPNKLTIANLTSLSFSNALIVVGVSLVIGAVLGYVSALLGAAMTSKSAAPA